MSPVTVQSGARSVRWEDRRVDHLAEEIHHREGEPGQHDVPAPAFDLDRIHVDDQAEQGDRGPLEGGSFAQDGLGLPDEVGDRPEAATRSSDHREMTCFRRTNTERVASRPPRPIELASTLYLPSASRRGSQKTTRCG